MRPPEFTGGNSIESTAHTPDSGRFNEAAGIHRRKRASKPRRAAPATRRFNEAAGIHRRKPPGELRAYESRHPLQ